MSYQSSSRLLFCVALAALTGACATVTRGTKEAWSVESVPPGASVTTTNGFACNATPCTFKMKRNSTFQVTVSKTGYKPYHGDVVHAVSDSGAAGMAGNVILGGLIGIGVDASSGAMDDLKPDPMKVTLEAEAPAAAPEAATAAAAPAPEQPAAAPAATVAPTPASAPTTAAAPPAAEAPKPAASPTSD
jgi:hypothetical protein